MDISSSGVNGHDAACADQGIGPALLCVHGWGANLRYWRHFWPVVTPRFRAIAVDLPGFGRSAGSNGFPFTMEAYADWLAAFLDAKGIADVTLIGHSMGGMISTLFAARHPSRVRRLILLNPAVHGPTAVSARSHFAMKPLVRQFFFLASRSIKLLHWAARDFVSVHRMADEDVLSIRMATLRTLNKTFQALIATDVRPAAGAIRVPTLILNSEDDRIIDPAQGELLAKALPGAKRTVFPRIGHCAQLEDPLQFNLAVMKFLQDEPRAFRPRQW